MGSAVERLRAWVLGREATLASLGITFVTAFPDPNEDGSKAAIQLENERWGVQYSVWDTPVLQSAVDVIEKATGKVWARDAQPRDAGSVDTTLAMVITGMTTNDFGLLGPSDSISYEDPPNV